MGGSAGGGGGGGGKRGLHSGYPAKVSEVKVAVDRRSGRTSVSRKDVRGRGEEREFLCGEGEVHR